MTLGSGAMTNTIEDITHDSDVILLCGSNPEEAHPVIGMQVRQAVARGAKLIVVDPREIGLAKQAAIHLKLKPGTNVAFANGMMNVFIEEGLIDKEFIANRTEGFEELAAIVKDYTPEKVGEICHIDPEDLRAAARLYAKADRAPIMYCLGVTEHHTGTEGVMSMSNMAMMVGKLGKAGCGVNPIRGQNNVQGACDMGAQPNVFTGYQKVADPAVVEKFEKAWGVDLKHLQPGRMATECFHDMIDGKIKGLFIFGEDPIVTDPDTNHVIKALESLDFLVVDELFMTETAKYADVILPGRSYLEKEGTFSNTERRVQRVRKAIEIPGTKPDTEIFSLIMQRMGYDQPILTPAEIMDEISSVTPSFAGISHERLDSPEIGGRGLQWPCTSKEHPGTPIMHVGKFARGLGYFYPAKYQPSTQQVSAEYPLIMITGRILYHYNACAMTAKTPEINEISSSSFIEINTEDAKELGISDGDKVYVSSPHGRIASWARVSGKTSKGEVWMPFHFLDGNSNWLVGDHLDDFSKTPEYKVTAVHVEKAVEEKECCRYKEVPNIVRKKKSKMF